MCPEWERLRWALGPEPGSGIGLCKGETVASFAGVCPHGLLSEALLPRREGKRTLSARRSSQGRLQGPGVNGRQRALRGLPWRRPEASPGRSAPGACWVPGGDPDQPHARPRGARPAHVAPFPGPGSGASGFTPPLQADRTPGRSSHKLADPLNSRAPCHGCTWKGKPSPPPFYGWGN